MMRINQKEPLDPTAFNSNIEVDLLSNAYQNLPAMLALNLVAALGCSFVFLGYDTKGAGTFLAITLVLTCIRFFKWYKFKQAIALHPQTPINLAFWQNSLGALLCFAGLVWAVLGFIGIAYAPREIEYPIVITMAALAGGATAITAPLKYIGKYYIGLLLLPAGISFLLHGTMPYLTLAVLDLVFLLGMLFIHDKNHKILKESYALRSKNSALVESLQEINNHLEDTVDHRTQELKEIAHIDALTSIKNRRGLMSWMQHNLNTDKPVDAAVLFLDLDRFKEINDAKGHEIGDKVLQMVAERFNAICGDQHQLARWGGDEFIIVIENSHQTTQLANALIASLAKPLVIDGEELTIGVSIGSAYYPTDANTFKGVIHAADLAAAEVKRTGRGQLVVFDERYAETQKDRFELSRALASAIESKEITVEYQPIVNVKTGEIDTFEALARWNHAGKRIDTETFISLAEKTDRIIALGHWVLEIACTEAATWLKAGHQHKVAVNVSIKQLLSNQFLAQLSALLNRVGLPPEQLAIEVTESLFNEEHQHNIEHTLSELKALGINIQIDDFGTGYSSLSRLSQFPIHTIKIDRSFVTQIEGQGRTIIESTIHIARSFNLQVIAEGVETQEQAQALYQMGVDYLQGYYFSRPSSSVNFSAANVNWQHNIAPD